MPAIYCSKNGCKLVDTNSPGVANDWGDEIRKIRVAAGISMIELAKAMRLSLPYLSRLERQLEPASRSLAETARDEIARLTRSPTQPVRTASARIAKITEAQGPRQ